MNPEPNRFAPRRLLVVALIGAGVMLVLGIAEGALRELLDYPYYGPIIGAGGGIVIWFLLFFWRGGYPKN